MDTVSVAFCFNNAFCHLAAAAIASLIRHASPQVRYELYIVHDDISPYNQLLLGGLNDRDCVTIRFVSFSITEVTDADLDYEQHTRYTFSRLFLHRVLPGLERVLYLDADTVLTADVAALFHQDLCGHALGACLDELSLLPPQQPCLVPRLRGYPYDTLHDYLHHHLGLADDQTRAYFNAGVLLLDLRRAGAMLDRELPGLLKNRYLMGDQDILNIIFSTDRQVLDSTYNVFAGDQVEDFIRARGHLPAVIHYNGNHKPCDEPSMTRAGNSAYWKALAGTDFYFQALERYITARSALASQQMTARTLRKLMPLLAGEHAGGR